MVTRRAAVGLALSAAAAPAMGAPAGAATTGAATGGEMAMEKVLGIGGFFFRSKDPKALAKWYEDNLGINPVPTSYDGAAWETQGGTTVFAPFPETTKMFGKPAQMWMINFRVRDLDKLAAQLRKGGAVVEIDAETYPNGRFATTHDPEGNPIQLWQEEDKG